MPRRQAPKLSRSKLITDLKGQGVRGPLSTYPLQGSTLSDLNIELLDQNGERVDTQGEGFSLTLVVEYDMD
jgi:hypothetical protein